MTEGKSEFILKSLSRARCVCVRAGYGLHCHRAVITLCKLIGIKDMYCKVDGSVNLLNITRALFTGLANQVRACDQRQPHTLANSVRRGAQEQTSIMLSCCRKPTRSWRTGRSSTWWSFRITKARCPRWWRLPKTEHDLTRSPTMRSPTHDFTGPTLKCHRDSSAPPGPASSAPSGRV